MKKIISYFVFIYLFIPILIWAYDPLFDADNPADLGTVPASYQPSAVQTSYLKDWKSVEVTASANGTVTHFLIRLLGTTNITTHEVGFAVYADDGPSGRPGTLIASGYYANYSFGSGAGWYALPFTSPTTFAVTASTNYHLAYLVERSETALNYARSNDDSPFPDKWGNSTLDQDDPPEGAEWDAHFTNTSAPWVMGLLIGEASLPSVTGCTISGGTFR